MATLENGAIGGGLWNERLHQRDGCGGHMWSDNRVLAQSPDNG